MENKLFSGLGSFFTTEDEKGIALTSEEEEVLSAYEALTKEYPEIDAGTLCAFIDYSGKCGLHGGKKAFVQNRRKDRRVRATVRVRWQRGTDSGTYSRTKRLYAGARQQLGCTILRNANDPRITYYSFRLIGCEVLDETE